MQVRLREVLKGAMAPDEVGTRARSYLGRFDDSTTRGSVEARRESYTELVNAYYDLVTDFYEYGWGESFHFAPRKVHETFPASIARHEHFIAKALRLEPGMKVVDVGCGVGGPMREMARFSGASFVGINNNAYQIERGEKLNARYRLDHLCSFHKADFMNTGLPDGSFDAAYAIEATCHAPDRTQCYREILRLLKPGGEFFAYEWCLTDRFDASDARHQAIKRGIEAGDGLPDLATTRDVDQSMIDAGFELVAARDLVADSDPETPWWLPLQGEGVSVASFRSSRFGRWVTHRTVGVLETLRIAPKGTQFVHGFLNDAAEALIDGGRTGIFTPMYMVHGRKPH